MSSTDQDQQPSAFRIVDLPPELLDGIASCLCKDYLLGFRQSCKKIYQHTTVAFARCFFHIIQTDLSLKSLQRLEAIAADGRFAHHVHSLLVKGRHHNHIGRGIEWKRDMHGYLLPQPAIDRVCDIVRSFPKCASFHFEICGEYCGNVLGPLDIPEALHIILTIVIDQNRPLKCLEIYPVCCQNPVPIPHYTDIGTHTMATVQTPELKELASSLQSFTFGYQLCPGIHVPTPFAFRLMECAPKLRRLNLDGQGLHGLSNFIDETVARNFDFQLEDLSLAGSSFLAYQDLHTFLRLHCRNLKALRFRDIGFANEGWFAMLNYLATGFTNLNCIELVRLFQPCKEQIVWVEFSGVIQDPIVDTASGNKIQYQHHQGVRRGAPRVLTVSYDGPRMDVALQKIAASAIAIPDMYI